MQRVVLHLPRSWLGPFGSGVLPFYERLEQGLRRLGHPVERLALNRDRVLETVAADDALHIVNHGRFRHPRLLNAGIAYVYPFWNLDPQGIRAFSSIAGQRFDPSSVDAQAARPFFRRLKQRLVGGRGSRYEQPRHHEDLPPAAAAVFLQSEAHRVVGETCYLDRWQMLETVLASCDAPVIVKPHPRDGSQETRAGLRDLATRFPHLRLSGGNIHDIIAAADRVVTINSAVGIEACLHRKPVILCGQADFHHVAQTARTPDDLAGFLTRPPRKRAYDKFIYWYFGLNCLSTTQEDLAERALDRFAQASGSVR
ncbi:hypothetical protein [Pukyongiella litopenaei]|uniref:Capsule polysaccharide biosynthesis protein n=1 Tax=Pukyongiella litopenaei TaxID=2605946 RepID=A0A2S0MKM6_9RHOB|nr:hypothetical protein [Pukyongiella litopenaei]AVO36429.1 hypothetical protein C6Y53_01040 [Pukyongiella litopenaei]